MMTLILVLNVIRVRGYQLVLANFAKALVELAQVRLLLAHHVSLVLVIRPRPMQEAAINVHHLAAMPAVQQTHLRALPASTTGIQPSLGSAQNAQPTAGTAQWPMHAIPANTAMD